MVIEMTLGRLAPAIADEKQREPYGSIAELHVARDQQRERPSRR
ncbi:hypothetical protein [Nannocystis pusilla]